MKTAKELFIEALERHPPDQWADFLRGACGGDGQLSQRVEVLLKAHLDPAGLLDEPAIPAPITLVQPLLERPGARIGPYKLMEQIGEGGFGLVFVAEQQQPLRRKVAIKVIKPGMDSREVVARFEAERQALAMMDHANIAKVLDAGSTESGRPYFVMELVRGVPITEYCDENQLNPRERLTLFISVCHAVQHAHQKGVIHRDLKPNNILVAPHDGLPVVKVIDFGVAKALGQQLTDKTVYTRFAQIVGTPLYMSPEQAEINALDVDTRSDIYALGVLLYELITGTTPFDKQRLHNAAFDEIRRIIRQEEPPCPSTRISSLGLTLPDISARRKTDPSRLSAVVRGELDWIVMKCLEKDRTRRYETANGLARDIERFLRDEPVEACPPSLLYRSSKFLRKHRIAVAVIAAVVLVSVLVAIGQTVNLARAHRAETIAARERDKAIAAERDAEQAREAAEASLASERIARADALASKERAESYSRRLHLATEMTNEGVDYYFRGNWARAYSCFARAEVLEPDLQSIYVSRGMLYTTLGLWDRAAADYDRRFRLAPRSICQSFYEHALLKLYLGDEDGYRQVCYDLVNQFGGATTGDDRLYMLRACLLAPASDFQPLGTAADLVRRSENLVANSYVAWNLNVAALANLRAGNYARTADLSRRSIDMGPTSSTATLHRPGFLTLAMALKRLGQAEDAVFELAKEERAIDEIVVLMTDGGVGVMPLEWHKWLDSLVLYREAKSLISGFPPEDDPRLSSLYNRSLVGITTGDGSKLTEADRPEISRQEGEERVPESTK
jgi:serine/threonine protein kinase